MAIGLPKHHQKQSEENLARINIIKQAEANLLQFIEGDSREDALARTNIEQGVMWAIRGIAKPKDIRPENVKIKNDSYSGSTAGQFDDVCDPVLQKVKVTNGQYSSAGRLENPVKRTVEFSSRPLKPSGTYDLAAISGAYEVKADNEILCPFYTRHMWFLIDGVAVTGELKMPYDDDTYGEFHFEHHDLLVIVKGKTGSIEFISEEEHDVIVRGLITFIS